MNCGAMCAGRDKVPWKVKTAANKHVAARRPDNRLSARQRGYDSRWERIRAAHLREEPYCRICGDVGSNVDHIIPRARGGTNDPQNLQTLCASCHSAKTAEHDGGFGNRRR